MLPSWSLKLEYIERSPSKVDAFITPAIRHHPNFPTSSFFGVDAFAPLLAGNPLVLDEYVFEMSTFDALPSWEVVKFPQLSVCCRSVCFSSQL